MEFTVEALDAVHQDLKMLKDKFVDENTKQLIDELMFLCEGLDGYFGYLVDVLVHDEVIQVKSLVKRHRHLQDGTVVEPI